MYDLWEHAQLGPLTLRNRTVRSATNEHLSEPDGQFTHIWADTLIELAQNQVGLVITGHVCVDRDQRADEGQPVLDSRSGLDLLRRAAEGVHLCGSRLVMQLSHSGPKALPQVNGRPAKAPEDFSPLELDRLVLQFVQAAQLCLQAGLDGVQIHCAHGYLLSSFLNPQGNRRTDQYGGSLENRFRLPARILREIRAACGPRFVLLVKIDANGSGDLHRLLELLRETGVDGAEISGVDFNTRPGCKKPFYLEEAAAAQASTALPLILVGGIFSRTDAEQVLAAGIPFVSFSRALICQPDFVARLRSGELDESACLACNGCYSIYRRRPVRCVQHSAPIPQLEKVFRGIQLE